MEGRREGEEHRMSRGGEEGRSRGLEEEEVRRRRGEEN